MIYLIINLIINLKIEITKLYNKIINLKIEITK